MRTHSREYSHAHRGTSYRDQIPQAAEYADYAAKRVDCPDCDICSYACGHRLTAGTGPGYCVGAYGGCRLARADLHPDPPSHVS